MLEIKDVLGEVAQARDGRERNCIVNRGGVKIWR